MAHARIRLVGRSDDAGSCHSANLAIAEVVESGIARNVSVMAPCPAFEEAAPLLASRPGMCLGLHATITAEWDTLKWEPVLPAWDVPSLVDEDDYFLPSANAIHARGADPDEIIAEIEAQLNRARAAGLRIAYLDEHMAFGWLPGVEERLVELAQREGLLRISGSLARLPAVQGEFEDIADQFIARLEAAAPGTYLVVGHPGYDNEEMRQLAHPGVPPGQVARQRDADRRMFTSPKVLEYCRARGVQPIRYTEATAAQRPDARLGASAT